MYQERAIMRTFAHFSVLGDEDERERLLQQAVERMRWSERLPLGYPLSASCEDCEWDSG